jgi:hypothetical protein
VKLAQKHYPDVLQTARSRFPQLDWDHVSGIPSKVYMTKLSEVHKALACGAARVRAIDTVVGEVLQGRQDMSVCQGENGKGYEVFQHGRWDISSEFSGLCYS